MKLFTKRTIKSVLIINVLILGIFGCVPMQQFSEVEKENEEIKSKNKLIVGENEKLIVDTTELSAQIKRLKDKYSNTSSDTAILGRQLREYKRRLDEANKRNKDLIESQSKLAEGNADEVKRMLDDLQKAQEEMQKKEDELLELGKTLDTKKAELEKLRVELEEKNMALEEKNARLLELERMLFAKDSAVNALRNKVAAALGQFEKDGLTIHKKNGKVYVSLEEQLLFKSGKWDVDPKGQNALKKLANVLEQNDDINISIEGHTDNVPYNGKGQILDNWDLSVKRATAIVRILMTNKGIDPTRLTASGRGEFLPIDESNTPEARKKNRRIEIILVPQLDELFRILENN